MLEVVGPAKEGSAGIPPGWVLLHWAVQGQIGGLQPGVSFAVEVNSWLNEVCTASVYGTACQRNGML